MCGIGGIYKLGRRRLGHGDKLALSRLSATIDRRGPDAEGYYYDGGVGLVHRRLSIIDLAERSNQPMESDDWTLCYNGEVYNFRDLRRELETLGHRFRTTSDTEVVLLAIQEWGVPAALKRFAGMFAFLAYDKRDGRLFVARDHMGIKPVVFTRLADGGFCFASSVSGIVNAFPERNWERFEPALGSYFALGAPFTRGTAIAGIERVEPAQFIEIAPNGLMQRTRYWQPRYQPNFTLDDMCQIIREYEIADVKSALFLSGGVDSTFLASVTQSLDFFHLVSPEMQYAQEVADRFERQLVRVDPELSEYESDVRHAIAFHGEPLMSCGIPLSVSREIAARGYRMAVSANGADELLHGYPRTPIPEHRPDYMPLHERRTYRWFAEQVAHVFRDNRNFEVVGLDDFVPSIVEVANDATKKFYLEGFPPSASHRWFELMTYVLHDLNPTLDAASMFNSIEVRVPFLDHRIVEGALSWHGSKLVTATLGRKAPLKAHLTKYFPASFLHRPKLGFSIHGQQLSDISRIGTRAFERAKSEGFLKVKTGTRFGEFDRDMIYLGSSCYAFNVWSKWQQSRRVEREPLASEIQAR